LRAPRPRFRGPARPGGAAGADGVRGGAQHRPELGGEQRAAAAGVGLAGEHRAEPVGTRQDGIANDSPCREGRTADGFGAHELAGELAELELGPRRLRPRESLPLERKRTRLGAAGRVQAQMRGVLEHPVARRRTAREHTPCDQVDHNGPIDAHELGEHLLLDRSGQVKP